MKIVTNYPDEIADMDVLEIVSAKYVGNYAIHILFSDGFDKTVHFKYFLTHSKHPSIRSYLDENKFNQFSIVDGNLNWNDYELIFPVEDLYEKERI